MGIEFDTTTTPKYVLITSPTTQVTIQELVTTIRNWEEIPAHLSYEKVIEATGKQDLGGGLLSGIILALNDKWRIKFWSGVNVGTILDGTLVPTSGYNGSPVEPTGGDDTIIVNNQIGGVISVVGSGITEQDKLDIADRVWDEMIAQHVIAGSTGELLFNIFKMTGHKVTRNGDIITVYESDEITPWRQYNLANGERLLI